MQKGVLRNFSKFTGKHLCQSLFFNKVKKETLAQVFSCEFCENFKNTFFTEHVWTTGSRISSLESLLILYCYYKFVCFSPVFMIILN